MEATKESLSRNSQILYFFYFELITYSEAPHNKFYHQQFVNFLHHQSAIAFHRPKSRFES